MISTGYFWTIVILMMMGTISIRLSLIAISGKVKIPERARELFSFIPAAILPAFIVPNIFYHQGQVDLLAGKERFVVAIFAAMICLKTKSTLATILFGLIALFLTIQYL